MKRKDWVGKRYGRLVVREILPTAHYRGKYLQTRVLCECDCGGTAVVYVNNLRSGNTRSCGCWREERMYTDKNPARVHKARKEAQNDAGRDYAGGAHDRTDLPMPERKDLPQAS